MRFKLQHPQYHDTDGNPIAILNRDCFYFEIQADGNYETLATSEIYESRADAMHAIDLIAGNRIDVEILDITA